MARHKKLPASMGFKPDRPNPKTISEPWSIGYPWSGGDDDCLIHELRDLSYKERRGFLARETYPRYLYKFKAIPGSDPSHLEDILIHSRLYLGSPRRFNDPFDMSANIIARGTREDVLARIDGIAGVPRDDKESVRKEALEIVQSQGIKAYFDGLQAPVLFRDGLDSSGVASFSCSKVKERDSGPRSILMWSHYAESHRGLCFQFEIAREPLFLRELVQVEYEPRYPEVNWLSADFGDQLIYALRNKAPCWSYEHEWRFILRECANTYLPFGPEALTAVILGCEISATNENLVKRLVDKRLSSGLPPLKILRASRSQSEYKIRITR